MTGVDGALRRAAVLPGLDLIGRTSYAATERVFTASLYRVVSSKQYQCTMLARHLDMPPPLLLVLSDQARDTPLPEIKAESVVALANASS